MVDATTSKVPEFENVATCIRWVRYVIAAMRMSLDPIAYNVQVGVTTG